MLSSRPQKGRRRRRRIARRRQARALLAAAMGAAGLLASGCGGGSSSPFAGSFHAPPGYVAYHGKGYVVALPANFVAKPGTVDGQPAGSSVIEATKGGDPAARAQSEILLLRNPHLKISLGQVISNLTEEDRSNVSVSNAQISATNATVPGARAARIVTESYQAPDSPSNPTPTKFHRKWLMVLVKPGLLLDVVVANATTLGGDTDADAVIDSFRLKQ
jgi:hypothetical protein